MLISKCGGLDYVGCIGCALLRKMVCSKVTVAIPDFLVAIFNGNCSSYHW